MIRIFNYFANMISIVGLISWSGIAVVYIRFSNACDQQRIDRSKFLYRAPFAPYLGWYTLVLGSIIIFFNSWTVFLTGNWSTANFICGYLPYVITHDSPSVVSSS